MPPKSESVVRAVLFDVDGVLVDSEALNAEAAARMFLEDYGVRVDPTAFLPFIGTGEDLYHQGVADRYGLSFDLERGKRRSTEIFRALAPLRLKPIRGAVAFVRRCRELGLKTAVATSAGLLRLEANFQGLRRVESQIESFFDSKINGNDVARKKPFPDIYLEAARRLGVVPAKCLVVEDAVSGVQAARAAGCVCLGLMTSHSEAELKSAGAHFVALNLDEGLPLLETLGQNEEARRLK